MKPASGLRAPTAKSSRSDMARASRTTCGSSAARPSASARASPASTRSTRVPPGGGISRTSSRTIVILPRGSAGGPWSSARRPARAPLAAPSPPRAERDRRGSAPRSPGGMQAALLRGRVQLPPPPPRPQVLPRPHRARDRRAADAGEALVVEGVVGHGVVPDVAPDPVPAPVGERVELEDAAVIGVDLDLPDLATCHGLLAPEPRDPRVEALEGAAERLHLPDAAAELPVLDARVEEVD